MSTCERVSDSVCIGVVDLRVVLLLVKRTDCCELMNILGQLLYDLLK